MSPPKPSTAGARMQRLLALVPWVAGQDGPTVGEICSRFGISEAELAADLEVVWLVGLPPYTPDALIDVVQEGDRVWIHYADVFANPQRLTPDQAVALLTAGASVLALPGSDPEGPLASGVRKLAGVLGVDADLALDVDLGAASSEVLEVLRTAVTERRSVHLDYYSYGRDAHSERVVDPYLSHQAGGERRFRVDRIDRAMLLDDTFDPPSRQLTTTVFQPDDDDPRIVIDLAPEARWVAEAHPVEEREERPDGRLRVTLAIGGPAWVERLLVNLGPQAQVVGAPPELRDAGRRAADRILARYR
jgi:proteasome accessory factor C